MYAVVVRLCFVRASSLIRQCGGAQILSTSNVGVEKGTIKKGGCIGKGTGWAGYNVAGRESCQHYGRVTAVAHVSPYVSLLAVFGSVFVS